MRRLLVAALHTVVQCLSVFLTLTLASGLAAQESAPPASTATPADANALMQRAARSNRLRGEDVAPWRLKTSFKVLDENGAVKEEGTLDELWVSPTQFKRTYATATATATDFGTTHGVLFTGARELLDGQLADMEREFTSPVPQPDLLRSVAFELRPVAMGELKLDCLQARHDVPVTHDLDGWSYCVGAEVPMLRITSSALVHVQCQHNHVVIFQGHYVANDLRFVQAGKPIMLARMESLEPLADSSEAQFVPPADAQPETRIVSVNNEPGSPVMIDGGISAGRLLRKVSPDYPSAAKDARVTGVVVLKAILSKNGTIRNLEVVSGHALLRQAAMDAVKQWVYRPYLLNGDPVEVMTTINVVFSLNGSHF